MEKLTKEQIIQELNKLIIDNFGCSETEITPKKLFAEDFDADSLDMIDLMSDAENQLDIDLKIDYGPVSVKDVKTVQKFYDICINALQEQGNRLLSEEA